MTPPKSQDTPTRAAKEAARHAADQAAAMVGRPYHYGGRTPASGFDCSGLVQYSYRQAGIDVPRETGEQLRHGKRIQLASAVRGDLLFFNQEGKRASHVGIYLGDGRFVHAPSSGKHVRIDHLTEYWQRHLADARRFVD